MYSYSFEYNNYLENLSKGQLAAFCVAMIIICALVLIAWWKIFEKAGEKGWKVLIPIYNIYTEVKFVTGNGWMFLLLLVPIVNVIFAIWFEYQLAKAFGGGIALFIGLLLLNGIFIFILAFSNDFQYIGPKGAPAGASE